MKKTPDTLFFSRINAPKPPLHLYSRLRLIKLLYENSNKKLILLSSPAGYGKTTLVLDYLNKSLIKHAWVGISENIEHIYSFFNTIVFSLKKINPDFGEDTINLLKSHLEKNKFIINTRETVNDIVLTLSMECNIFFKDKIALVLDDYHHIEEIEEKEYLIDMLVQNLPSTVQVIVTSRQLPDLDFTNYVINEMILKIEMEDLVFNNAETNELFSLKYNIKNPGKANELTTKLGGWITGLHMISQGFGQELDNIEIENQLIPENIFNFLTEKTFNKLDNASKEFLLITSIIDNFNSELGKKLGINNFEKIINELLVNYTFVQTIPISYPDGTMITTYSYLALFKNFIQSKLFSLKSNDEIKEIYRITYQYYEQNNDPSASISYMIKAGDFEYALLRINKNFKNLFAEGKIEYLLMWLNEIPFAFIDNNTESLINLGILKKYYMGDLNSSIELLNKGIDRATIEKNYDLIVKAQINRAIVLQNTGKSSDAINELEQLISSPSFDQHTGTLKYYLAYALFHSSRYAGAEKLLTEMDAGKFTGNETVLSSTRKLLGHINLIKGNYIKAVSYYEKALNDEKNIIDKFEVLCNLTLLSSQSAEYSKARIYLDEIDKMITRFPTAVLKIPYLLAKQSYFFETGNYDAALEVMKNIYDEAFQISHKQYIYLSTRLITECLYYKKDYERAKKYFRISAEYLDRNNQLKSLELNVSNALLNKLSPEEKEKIFNEAYDYFKTNALLYNLAQVSYFLADLALKRNQPEKKKSYFDLCLAICSSNGYDSFLIREYKNDNSLIEGNGIAGGNKAYLDNIKQKAI